MTICAGRGHFSHRAQSGRAQARAPGTCALDSEPSELVLGPSLAWCRAQSRKLSELQSARWQSGGCMNTSESVQISGYGGIISGLLRTAHREVSARPVLSGVQTSSSWTQGSEEADLRHWGCIYISLLSSGDLAWGRSLSFSGVRERRGWRGVDHREGIRDVLLQMIRGYSPETVLARELSSCLSASMLSDLGQVFSSLSFVLFIFKVSV